jgi:hypothetical protein
MRKIARYSDAKVRYIIFEEATLNKSVYNGLAIACYSKLIVYFKADAILW